MIQGKTTKDGDATQEGRRWWRPSATGNQNMTFDMIVFDGGNHCVEGVVDKDDDDDDALLVVVDAVMTQFPS